MKKYLMMVCAASVLAGCSWIENRGGVRDRSSSQTGRDNSMQSTNSSSITNSSSSSSTQSQSQNSNAGQNNSSGQNNSGNNSLPKGN
jgi:hypothetical protein